MLIQWFFQMQINAVKNKKDNLKVVFFIGGEEETRTPAPVTRPTPLAGAPRHQLEYFSIGALENRL